MISVKELIGAEDIFSQLTQCHTVGSVGKASEIQAEIKGFHMIFQQLRKTPDLIRLLLQNEFHFDGVVNAYTPGVDIETLLATEWYPSTFVIPHYSNARVWAVKCVEERNKGKTVVCLFPSRTNTEWFHDYVIGEAKQIRFIRGRITMPGHTTQSPYADSICVYMPEGESAPVIPDEDILTSSKSKRKTSVAIISCSTSFTGTDSKIDTNVEKEPESEPEPDKRRSKRLKKQNNATV